MAVMRKNSSTTLYSRFDSEKEYMEMLEAVIEESDIGCLITDKEGTVIKVNPAHIAITGQPPEYNLGRGMQEIQIEDGSPSATVKVLESGRPVNLEQHLVNGKSYLVYSKPYFNSEGKLQYVFSNLLDTTQINATIEEIRDDNRRLNLQLSELQSQLDPHIRIIHQSKIMRNLILLCDKAAQFDSAILLQGESGVGKERVAEYIFEKSPRRKKPFVKINCAAIPEHLLESELFGYMPGAFSGADPKGKKGLLEYADAGTMLFDEISELTLPLQAKLLRFLQDGEFYRIGGVKPLKSDIRIIAASNQDLQKMVEAQEFREDFFYRLNVIPIYVPPLSARREDIPLLIGHFTKKFNQKHGLNKKLDIGSVNLLSSLSYKGNVRELQNTVERILVLADSDVVSDGQAIKIIGMSKEGSPAEPEILPEASMEQDGLKAMVRKYEERVIKEYMDRYGTEERVSKMLKVSQSTISRKLSGSRSAFQK